MSILQASHHIETVNAVTIKLILYSSIWFFICIVFMRE
jgi:hypothetical protein